MTDHRGSVPIKSPERDLRIKLQELQRAIVMADEALDARDLSSEQAWDLRERYLSYLRTLGDWPCSSLARQIAESS